MTIKQTNEIPAMRRYFLRREPPTLFAVSDRDVLRAASMDVGTAERFEVAIPITPWISAHVTVLAGLTPDGAPDVLVSGSAVVSGPATIDNGVRARVDLAERLEGVRRIREAAEACEAHLRTLEEQWVTATDGDRERMSDTIATTDARAKAYRMSLAWLGG